MSCNSVLANERLRPFKLLTHFNNVHGRVGTEEEMKRKRARFDQKRTLLDFGFVKHQKPILEASYEVIYLIAREKAPYTSGEKLIKSAALKMSQVVLGKKQGGNLKMFHYQRMLLLKINEVNDDVLAQVIAGINSRPIRVSLQLDKSTDVSNISQLQRPLHNIVLKHFFLKPT